ncbi:hypothetical protein [Thermoleptolyngbya sp.]
MSDSETSWKSLSVPVFPVTSVGKTSFKALMEKLAEDPSSASLRQTIKAHNPVLARELEQEVSFDFSTERRLLQACVYHPNAVAAATALGYSTRMFKAKLSRGELTSQEVRKAWLYLSGCQV